MGNLYSNVWKAGVVSTVMMMAVGCGGSSKSIVTIKYTLEPSKGLPPGLTQVAIMPAELGPATDAKWSDMTSDMLAGLIEDARDNYGTQLRVADRVETAKVFQESDLGAAGLTGGSGGQPAKLLGVQAFIVSKINIKTSTKKTKKTVISGISGHGWSHGGGGSAQTREAEKTTQTITAQAKFQLVDAKTGESWTIHEDKVQSTEETDPGFFMGIGGNSDLSPEDKIAGVLIERVAREFISKLIPCEVSTEVKVKSSHNEDCKKAVDLLRADMYEDALEAFKRALAEDSTDDKALYGAGVACEALGKYEEALKYYRRACVEDDDTQYIKAKNRLDKDIQRIKQSA